MKLCFVCRNWHLGVKLYFYTQISILWAQFKILLKQINIFRHEIVFYVVQTLAIWAQNSIWGTNYCFVLTDLFFVGTI